MVTFCVLLVGGVASVVLVPLFGIEYRPSLDFVWPLAVAAGLYGMARLGVGVSIARGRPAHATAIELTGMVAAFAAYLILIPTFGALGAAWGCLIGYGVGAGGGAVLGAGEGGPGPHPGPRPPSAAGEGAPGALGGSRFPG